MYRVSVYYTNGVTAWQGKLDDGEVVYQTVVRWLWLARWIARNNLGNCGNLAYVIHDQGRLVEEGPGQLLGAA